MTQVDWLLLLASRQRSCDEPFPRSRALAELAAHVVVGWSGGARLRVFGTFLLPVCSVSPLPLLSFPISTERFMPGSTCFLKFRFSLCIHVLIGNFTLRRGAGVDEGTATPCCNHARSSLKPSSSSSVARESLWKSSSDHSSTAVGFSFSLP